MKRIHRFRDLLPWIRRGSNQDQVATLAESEISMPPAGISPIDIQYAFRDDLFQKLGVAEEMKDERATAVLQAARPYSMVHETGIEFTIASIIYLIKQDIPGVFVEFGTWRGGCSLAMLLTQKLFFGKIRRKVYMYDSFEGLPKVSERDGPLAKAWQDGIDPKNYFDNCRAAKADLEAMLSDNGFTDSDFKIVRGWFGDSIAKTRTELQENRIALLRLDGDWYESTIDALRGCCSAVSEEGIVIVDDYYSWDGCARAVHDYLASEDLPYRIKSLPYNFGAYFVKRAHRTSFEVF